MTDGQVDERLATSRLTIDLEALAENWRSLGAMAKKANNAAALKADAYGLGIEPVAEALIAAGCNAFFVANPAEGVELRRLDHHAEIFVLGGLHHGVAAHYREAMLTPVLNCPQDVALWSESCRRWGMRRPAALHFDTGMNRLGMTGKDVRHFIDADKKSHPVSVSLVMSHLACAEITDAAMNKRQRREFDGYAKAFPGIRRSLSNSAGIFLGSDFHFEMTRPGIYLYGGDCGADGAEPLPVVTMEGRVLQQRQARKGETVGYGASHRLSRDSVIAVAGAGYGDGIMRAASGAGVPARTNNDGARGWYGGFEVPVLGRISMDLTAFDVTDVPEKVRNDTHWVEYFGAHRPIAEFARSAGTISYEVLTGLGKRSARIYRKENRRQP